MNKEQIRSVDNYLKDNGIKYWDLRLEMIDHFASKVESNEVEFNEKNLKKEFGTNDIYRSTIQKRMKLINIKYRRLFHLEIVNLIKSLNGLLAISILFLFEIILLNTLKSNVFIKTNMVFFFLTIIPILIHGLIQVFKNNRSLHLNYAFFYSFVSFLILQMFITVPAYEDFLNISENAHMILLSIIVPLHIIFTYSGLVVYQKAQAYYNKTYHNYIEICN